MSLPAQTSVVEEVPAAEIRRGDHVWAPDDGDWLLVDRMDPASPFGYLTFYRHDHSEAEFRFNQRVLRRVAS